MSEKMMSKKKPAFPVCKALDHYLKRYSRNIEIPIFYDSAEVKRAINEVEDAKNVILYIANRLTESIQQKAIIDEEDDNN